MAWHFWSGFVQSFSWQACHSGEGNNHILTLLKYATTKNIFFRCCESTWLPILLILVCIPAFNGSPTKYKQNAQFKNGFGSNYKVRYQKMIMIFFSLWIAGHNPSNRNPVFCGRKWDHSNL